ncbi:MAG: triose-phosphate isomerase [Bdellovibrionales bacterium]
MKKKVFAANWKLFKGPQETKQYFENFLISSDDHEIVFFPPALCIAQALQCVHGSRLQIGVQNISDQAEGALTGENSARTAQEMGCTTVLIGHSERRQLFGESLELISKKMKYAQSLGLKIILCVGESSEERESNRTTEVLKVQMETALSKASSEGLIIAYEPVWAIGTGKTATPQMANETQGFIRGWLDQNKFSNVPILYGGSVKPENAKDLISQPFIYGFLVGGASLNPESFAQICQCS